MVLTCSAPGGCRRRLENPRWPRAGFTLIEVLVALVVLAVGITALHGLTVTVLRSIESAHWRTRVVLAAVSALEREIAAVHARPAPGAPASTAAHDCRSGDRGLEVCTLTDHPDSSLQALVRVRVSVSGSSAPGGSYSLTSRVLSPPPAP